MLTVVDNLARALDHVPAEARAAGDPQLQSLIEGVELTARDLEAALSRHGVKKLDPHGQKFDPNFHQAIFEAPDETVPAGTVLAGGCRAAGRSATACLGPRWSAFPKAARRPRRGEQVQ